MLRAFEAAARLESFSLAARELHLSPSAISHHIRELEDYFGRPLFVRLHRKVELSAEGRRLSRTLTPLFDELEIACGDISSRSGNDVLMVHCAPSLAAKWLGPMLPEFMKKNPGVTIRLSSGAEPVDLNVMRDLDMAISYGHALTRTGIDVVPLGTEPIVPLCAPQLLRGKQPRQFIERATLIDSQLSPVTWRDWFTLNGMKLPPVPRPSFDRAALSISAAVDGMGIALESARLAARELASGALVEVGKGKFERIAKDTHFVSCRTVDMRLRKVELFRDWVLQKGGAIPST